jgi:hypothetical protein
LPASVTNIDPTAFTRAYYLHTITVDADNTTYQSIDGNLYSKDGATLVKYAPGKSATSFEIPDTVTSIGERAFEDADSLKVIVFAGTTEEWIAIAANSHWNKSTNSCVAQCSDGVVAKDGTVTPN